MAGIWLYTLVSVLLVSAISLVGIITLTLRTEKLKKIVLYLVSFSAGALFGDAFLHLLPEAIEESGFTLNVSLSVIAGIIFSFVIEKFIHWRHCHHPITKDHVHPFAVMNLVGDAVHNFIDGIIIAASYIANIQIGIATTIAVVLHEIPQEMGNFGVLIHGGFSKWKALLVNFMTALTAILGAVLALALSNTVENMALLLIPFAAGGFIYIAGSDLIPEMHKEVKVSKSLLQFIAFVLGVLVMVALLMME